MEGQECTSSHHGYKNILDDLSREYMLRYEKPIEIKVVGETLDH
jgi:hypothetical protein